MYARVVFFLAALGIVHSKLLNSCKITETFVNTHNSLRLQLAQGKIPGQPAASKMTYMIWDDELAAKAQKWASKNKYGEHNPDKTLPSGRFEVGENIYWYGTTDLNFQFDPTMAMNEWWMEHKDYNYTKLTMDIIFKDPNKQIAHYTQMAWAESVRIGCGVSEEKEKHWINFFVVCDYGPPGNYLGETPYVAGKPSNKLVCANSTDCDHKYGSHC